jgi:8-oxo-dGTP pyrophosphatase MutT (NUDIX family)
MIQTTGLFILNALDELLITHPTNSPFNRWSIPKGIPDLNETYLDAAIRELFEETNINVIDLKISEFEYGDPVPYKNKLKNLQPIFCRTLVDTGKLSLKCNSLVDGESFYENDIIKWYPIKDAIKLIHETQVKAIKSNQKFNSKL